MDTKKELRFNNRLRIPGFAHSFERNSKEWDCIGINYDGWNGTDWHLTFRDEVSNMQLGSSINDVIDYYDFFHITSNLSLSLFLCLPLSQMLSLSFWTTPLENDVIYAWTDSRYSVLGLLEENKSLAKKVCSISDVDKHFS